MVGAEGGGGKVRRGKVGGGEVLNRKLWIQLACIQVPVNQKCGTRNCYFYLRFFIVTTNSAAQSSEKAVFSSETVDSILATNSQKSWVFPRGPFQYPLTCREF